jgi:hypothetical protein
MKLFRILFLNLALDSFVGREMYSFMNGQYIVHNQMKMVEEDDEKIGFIFEPKISCM